MLEMSMVLITIGILITTIIGGSSMIRSAKLTSARAITSKSIVPNIEGLVAWYETTSIDSLKPSQAYDGAQIDTWYDISPESLILQKNKLTRTASNTVTYQTNGINKIPSVKFDGSSTISTSSFYQGSLSRATIFFVAQPLRDITTTATVVDSGNTNLTSISFLSNGIQIDLGTTSTISVSECCKALTNYAVASYLNGSSSKTYVNNAATMAGGSTVSAGSNSMIGFTVGATSAGSYSFTGLVSEIIIYNRPLKDSERKEVFRYLSNKYKIPVQGL